MLSKGGANIRYIFIRVVEKIPKDRESKVNLQEIENIVDNLMDISWKMLPIVDSRGGFKLAFIASENLDLDILMKKLDESGYLIVF
jgi:hypothetical protein